MSGEIRRGNAFFTLGRIHRALSDFVQGEHSEEAALDEIRDVLGRMDRANEAERPAWAPEGADHG